MILDFHHRLTRKTIDIAVTKILSDMKHNTKRSVRNLVDLGALFSGSENQKTFFAAARKVLSGQNNPYYDFAARVSTHADNTTVKTVGLNLGYSSLIYGADKLRKNQAAIGRPLPWLIVTDATRNSPQVLTDMISDGRALGIYSHIFRLRGPKELLSLSRISPHFEECFFILDTPASTINTDTATAVSRIHNTVVSIRLAKNNAFSADAQNAFQILNSLHCLFGFSISYDDETEMSVTSDVFLNRAVKRGVLFIVYIPARHASELCRQRVYSFVRKTRGQNGRPILVFEWHEDLNLMSEWLGTAGALHSVNPYALRALKNALPAAEKTFTRS